MFAKRTLVIGVMSFITLFSVSTQLYAQQGPNLLLEVQALKEEIAQLRDMIERQGYQIRKLQQAQIQPQVQNVPEEQSSVPANVAVTDTQVMDDQVGIPGTVADAPLVPELDTMPTDNQPVVEQQSGEPVLIPPVEQTVEENLPNVEQAEQTMSGAYQPDQQAVIVKPSSSANSAQTSNQQQVEIVDRPVGAAANDDAYATPPPIEEIPVGERATSPRVQPPTVAPQAPLPASTEVIRQPLPEPVLRDSVTSTGVVQIPQSQEQPQVQLEKSPQVTDQPITVDDSAAKERASYQRGFDFLKESKHDQAVESFKKQLEEFPQGELADDANYWIAESMYVNSKLDDSKKYYSAIREQFPQSPRMPDAMLKSAFIEQEQGNLIEAKILLQEIIQYYPRSNAAISANNRLAEIK